MIIWFRVCHFLFFRLGFRVYFLFLHKKRRLRQRSSSKKQFFHEKKAPAATFQHQKAVFHKKRRLRQRSSTKKQFFQKKGACGNAPAPKIIYLLEKKAPAATFQDPNPISHPTQTLKFLIFLQYFQHLISYLEISY